MLKQTGFLSNYEKYQANSLHVVLKVYCLKSCVKSYHGRLFCEQIAKHITETDYRMTWFTQFFDPLQSHGNQP